MATFAYSGRTRAGQNVTGEKAADTMESAIAALRREQVMVSKINPVKEKAEAAAKTVIKRKKKVSPKSLAVFTRQFSVMIDAGLPLVQCLEILGTQEEDKNFGAVILETRAEVEGGASLADAMKKNPKVFDPLYTNMIAAGEAGGILDTILKRLATYIEKAVKLKNQVQSAMVYPVAIVVIATVVVGVILWKVIPTFANLFAGLGAELPLPTRVVIALSNFIADFWWLIGILIGGGFYATRRYYGTYKGKRVLDKLLLKMPVLGILLRKIAVARFCRTLATLTSSGVPILDGLQITARTAGNSIVEDAIMATRKSVEEGKTISEPLGDTEVFPPMVVQMIAVGEQTGALDTMLTKIADFYEDEVDIAVAGLMKLLEPVLIAFLGVAIGGIVIAMYMPMFSLIGQIG